MPDDDGYIHLDTIGVRMRADGQQLVIQVAATGEVLRTTTELREALIVEEQARRVAEQAQQAAEQQAADESAARQRAEVELAQLRAEIARLRAIDPST